jgi:hypothetical protein
MNITIEVNDLSFDIATIMIKNQYAAVGKDPYEYDEKNNILIFTKEATEELNQLENSLKEFILLNHKV